MSHTLTFFLLHLGITALSLGAASRIVPGVQFKTWGDLLVSALLLGLVNAVVKPALVLFTFPLTLLTLGLFVLVINALMIMLVAALVRGFAVPSFWSAFLTGIIVSLLSLSLNTLFDRTEPLGPTVPRPITSGIWT